jgi:hypothetical protein
MTHLSRLQTCQRGNSPDSSGDRIGNIMAIMMINQASDRDKQRQEQEERCKEFCLSLELQRQQMQQQQNVMKILLINAVGMTNPQQQQVDFSNNGTTDNQQQQNLGGKEKSKQYILLKERYQQHSGQNGTILSALAPNHAQNCATREILAKCSAMFCLNCAKLFQKLFVIIHSYVQF